MPFAPVIVTSHEAHDRRTCTATRFLRARADSGMGGLQPPAPRLPPVTPPAQPRQHHTHYTSSRCPAPETPGTWPRSSGSWSQPQRAGRCRTCPPVGQGTSGHRPSPLPDAASSHPSKRARRTNIVVAVVAAPVGSRPAVRRVSRVSARFGTGGKQCSC